MSPQPEPAEALAGPPGLRARLDGSAGGGPRARLLLAVGTVAVLLAIVAVLDSGFYSATNLGDIGQLTAVLGTVALGQAVVMLAGGIDLSVGAITGITLVIVASVTNGDDGRLPLAILACFGAGLGIGAINAILVVGRRVPPFVATLGTMILVQGIVTAWTNGSVPGRVPGALRSVSTSNVGPLSIALGVFVVLVVLTAWVLRRTTFGRRIRVVGLNDLAAVYAGLRVNRVRAATYLISATLAVVGGLLLAAYVGYVDQYAGQDLHLQSIAAAVVGGVSLMGGRGTLLGAALGALLMTVVLDLGLLAGLSGQTQSILTGVVLIVAAFVYGYRQRGLA